MREALLPLAAIRRPLQRVLDEAKVAGVLWGFNGCHRVAAHERLGRTTIHARVRRANREVLRMHLM